MENILEIRSFLRVRCLCTHERTLHPDLYLRFINFLLESTLHPVQFFEKWYGMKSGKKAVVHLFFTLHPTLHKLKKWYGTKSRKSAVGTSS